MKKNFRKIGLTLALSASLLLGGCDLFNFGNDLPVLGIDWTSITADLETDEKKTTLSSLGWYADTSEIKEFGTITFYNYDFEKLTAFKQVPYQFYIAYGCGYELDEKDNPVYYPHPVYEIMLVDNNSDKYYGCTYDDNLKLMNEEGTWFLTEDKSEYISNCLTNCQSLIVLWTSHY